MVGRRSPGDRWENFDPCTVHLTSVCFCWALLWNLDGRSAPPLQGHGGLRRDGGRVHSANRWRGVVGSCGCGGWINIKEEDWWTDAVGREVCFNGGGKFVRLCNSCFECIWTEVYKVKAKRCVCLWKYPTLILLGERSVFNNRVRQASLMTRGPWLRSWDRHDQEIWALTFILTTASGEENYEDFVGRWETKIDGEGIGDWEQIKTRLSVQEGLSYDTCLSFSPLV